jgi:hypothetical protein
MKTNNNIEDQDTYSLSSISEFERTKPRETYRKLNSLISDIKFSAFLDKNVILQRLAEIKKSLEDGK